jgi:hypothetical protein
MAVANNFKAPVDGVTYQPNTYAELGEMIGKVAHQIIRQVEAKDPLAVFDKMPVNKGDTIEQAVIKLVEASAYDKTGADALTRATNEKMLVRYFNNWERRKYKQTIDRSELRKVLVEGTSAEDVTTNLVSVLGQSRIDDKFQNVKKLLKWGATAGSLAEGTTALKSLGTVPAVGGAMDNKGILKKIKNTVKGMKFVNADFNTAGLRRKTNEEDIYIIAPYTLITAIDVDELSGVFNLDKAEVRSRIIEIDSTDNIVYIVDRNAILDYTRLYEMVNQLNADGLFYNYFLHVEDLFAISPLFDGCFFEYGATA